MSVTVRLGQPDEVDVAVAVDRGAAACAATP
jgi:hypothetical protein